MDQYLDDPNVRRFLDLISAAEGTTEAGYNALFGGGTVDSLESHPNKSKSFTNTEGKKQRSTAAGRYQILGSVWDSLADRLGLEDFSERSQDLGAIELIREKGALDDVVSGDYVEAINKLGSIWASIPSSTYNQPKRSWDWVEDFLSSPTEPEIADAAATTVASTFDPELTQALALAAQGNQMALDFPEGIAQEDWEDDLLAMTLDADADEARNQAVADLLGVESVPDLQLPKRLDRAINSIIAGL